MMYLYPPPPPDASTWHCMVLYGMVCYGAFYLGNQEVQYSQLKVSQQLLFFPLDKTAFQVVLFCLPLVNCFQVGSLMNDELQNFKAILLNKIWSRNRSFAIHMKLQNALATL